MSERWHTVTTDSPAAVHRTGGRGMTKATCDGCRKYRLIVRQWQSDPTIDGYRRHLSLYCEDCDRRLFAHLRKSGPQLTEEEK